MSKLLRVYFHSFLDMPIEENYDQQKVENEAWKIVGDKDNPRHQEFQDSLIIEQTEDIENDDK
jgi:hypothetical protein